MATKLATKIVGFESANSYVKVYSQEAWFAYVNTISKAPKESFNLTAGLRNSNTVYEYEGGKYTVGRTLDFMTSSTKDIKRYATDEYRRESIFALAHVAKDGDNIHAVTGLPSNHYKSKDQAIKMIQDNLKGNHSLIINGEEVNFTVKKVTVTLQPLATFFYCVLDEFGQSDEEMIKRFDGTKTLVVDIGWGTTDLAVLEGSSLLDFLEVRTSMLTAYRNLYDAIIAKFRDRTIVSAGIPYVELERLVRKGPVISVANEQYDCTELIESIFQETTGNILQEVRSVVNMADYTSIVFTGGGAMALQDNITEQLSDPKSGRLQENVFILGDAQMANPKGYFVYVAYAGGE